MHWQGNMTNSFKSVNEIMERAIDESVFPAASLLVAYKGETVFKNYYGACTEETIFDVASLTKPMVTTALVMKAVSEGLLTLNDKLSKFFPDEPYNKNIRLKDLLTHTSGLPALLPYYDEIPRGEVASVEGRAQIIHFILNEQLVYKTGEQSLYSDLGFILLGDILETIFMEPLIELADEFIFKPLNMKNSFFRVIESTPWSDKSFEPAYVYEHRDFADIDFAPTEDCSWRGKVLKGIVNDKNAYALGGVAGHAGLFSTIDDIGCFVSEIVSSFNGKGNFLGKGVIKKFIDFDYVSPGSEEKDNFLLGWDRPIPKNSSAGRHFSKNTIGHLGYTGCSMWIDLKEDLSVIFLSNRTYPSATNEKIRGLRPILHDKIWGEISRIKPK